MSSQQEIQELAENFRAFGASEPEDWASSQIKEGIPQYGRFVFLQQAWRSVIAEDDTSWIDQQIRAAEQWPRDPGAGIGPALKRLLSIGASREDIAEVVRIMQWQTLAAVIYQIDDSGVVAYPSEQTLRVGWALFELDADFEPLHPLGGLHESVLDAEPTGREMRPKGVTREG